MKKLYILLFAGIQTISAQVGIFNTNPKAQLDITASSVANPSNTDGILVPRVNIFPAVNPTVDQNGMMLFLTTASGSSQPGFYYWNNPTSSWVGVGSNTSNHWNVNGNSGTSASTNFIGTVDNQDLIIKRFNSLAGVLSLTNTSYGASAFNILSSGGQNTAIGNLALSGNTTGFDNTAIGYSALQSNTTGFFNAAIGRASLSVNTTGSDNTALGYQTLRNNTIGNFNTAAGRQALFNNNIGQENTAVGKETLKGNTSGGRNTALGNSALEIQSFNNGGVAWFSNNTAIGYQSLFFNQPTATSNGINNSGVGAFSLSGNTTGFNNSALGVNAGSNITIGSRNLMLGQGTTAPSAIGNDQLNIGNTIFGSIGAIKNIGINTTVPQGILDITSTTNGIVIPRVTLTSSIVQAPVVNPQGGNIAISTLVYNTATAGVAPNNVLPGFNYWDGVKWLRIDAEDAANNWGLTGNAGTAATTNFIGTVDNQDIVFRRNNVRSGRIGITNTSFGVNALNLLATGLNNVAIGVGPLLANTNGSENIAIGNSALAGSTTSRRNVAIGFGALQTNSFANSGTAWDANNTAVGYRALNLTQSINTFTGTDNTAVGTMSLAANTTGSDNTALGSNTLAANTTGSENTALGSNTLAANTGTLNIAVGAFAMDINTTGFRNVAVGAGALGSNTTGQETTAVGDGALAGQTAGSLNNTAVGRAAAFGTTIGDANTAIGRSALGVNITGNLNVGLGAQADVSLSSLTNGVAIGTFAIVNASNKLRLGNTTVGVIEGQVAYSFPSDARFKYSISQNVPGLNFILKLKPVTYKFDGKKFDEHLVQMMSDSVKRERINGQDYTASSKIIHSGFLAQDIEKITKELNYDFDGLHVPDPANPTDNYSVAYSQFIMPIVKSIQEQQAIIIFQNQEIERLKFENQALKTEVASNSSRLQSIESRLSEIAAKK